MLNWWDRQENVYERGDFAADPDAADYAGSDLVQDAPSIYAMERTPLGEPPVDFDVRCVYDSRPVNAYDFNLSQSFATTSSAPTIWSMQFVAPLGYRMIPKKFEILYDPVPPGPVVNSTVSILQQQTGLNNNQNIVVGGGGTVDTFFIVEEQTTFGITGTNTNTGGLTQTLNGVVNVWGQMIPVLDVALPFTAANKTYRRPDNT
jgi:hypothetical protein